MVRASVDTRRVQAFQPLDVHRELFVLSSIKLHDGAARTTSTGVDDGDGERWKASRMSWKGVGSRVGRFKGAGTALTGSILRSTASSTLFSRPEGRSPDPARRASTFTRRPCNSAIENGQDECQAGRYS